MKEENNSKTVSVVMCTYNGDRFLRQQLDSIVNQTFSIYELIIQDDQSTDSTWEILKEYESKYSYVHIYQNEQRRNINDNFFTAINRAGGDFIAISDQDDIWELNKLEVQIDSIGDNWLSSGFSKPFSADTSIEIHFDDRVPNYTLERMIYVGMTPGHTMLIRRNLIDKISELDRWKTYFMYDRLIQMVAAAYGKIQFCNVVLVNNRRHVSAATYTPAQNYQRSLKNIVASIKRTVLLYLELRPFMREHFFNVYDFLASIPSDVINKENAMKMAYYQSQSSIISYLSLSLLCLKVRNKIFYSIEKNAFFSILRALYFPISCSDYFRYMSKNFKK